MEYLTRPEDIIVEFDGPNMPWTIYTVGTEYTSIPSFMNAMVWNDINAIVDMRENPESDAQKNFRKDKLINLLTKYKIHYRRYPELIEKHINPKTMEYLKRIKMIENAVNKGYKFCFLSETKLPTDTDRCKIIGQYFYKKEYRVIHLYPKNGEETDKKGRQISKWRTFIYHEELVTRIARQR